jgi:hypothetical protein
MSTFLEQTPEEIEAIEVDDYTRIMKELTQEEEFEWNASWKAILTAELDRRKKLQQ